MQRECFSVGLYYYHPIKDVHLNFQTTCCWRDCPQIDELLSDATPELFHFSWCRGLRWQLSKLTDVDDINTCRLVTLTLLPRRFLGFRF